MTDILNNKQIDWTSKNSNMTIDIGKICQFECCKIKDFLPFKCEYCKNIYCLDHRTYLSHKCTQYNDPNLFPMIQQQKIPKYIKCQVSDCNNVLENFISNKILSTCNKCKKIRCKSRGIYGKCCK